MGGWNALRPVTLGPVQVVSTAAQGPLTRTYFPVFENVSGKCYCLQPCLVSMTWQKFFCPENGQRSGQMSIPVVSGAAGGKLLPISGLVLKGRGGEQGFLIGI